MASALYEARREFPADQEFSAWLGANKMDNWSHQVRAALINMGEHHELTREVLPQTQSSSLELIWRNEIQPRVTNARKPAPKRKSAFRENPKAQEVVSLRQAGKSLKEITNATGLHPRSVDNIVAKEKARQEGAQNLTDELRAEIQQKVIFESLPLSQKEKLIRWRDREIKLLGRSFHKAVSDQVAEATQNHFVDARKQCADHLTRALRIMNAREGFMTKAVFNQIRFCLHSDTISGTIQLGLREGAIDPDLAARYDKALIEFLKLEKYLLAEKDSPTTAYVPPLPTTWAEWEKMKAEATRARKAARAAKKDLVK